MSTLNITQLSAGGDGTIMGQNAADPISFHGVTPAIQQVLAVTTSSTDATTAIALANALRTALINYGLVV